MVVALVALAPRRVQGDVSHHTPVHALAAHELSHQLNPLRVSQLVGQGHP